VSRRSYDAVKRALDVVAAIALVLTLPLKLVVALLVNLEPHAPETGARRLGSDLHWSGGPPLRERSDLALRFQDDRRRHRRDQLSGHRGGGIRMTRRAYDPLKRLIDIAVSATALVLLAPVLGALGLVVRRELGSPVLFRQPRPGKDEGIFELVKFRTMLEPARGLVTDEQRLTPVGGFLRATSLDELPTLWNVLKGDMSLVGPRPLLVQYLPRYSATQARRHEVRPGVTGLAQVSGRNALSWDEKLALDVEYVERRSLLVDARIIVRTFAATFRRHGISAEGEATMPEFTGPGAGKP
jgi:lipopolysaccharide/colanic/teichoic acid biosynthesis glycosyltransferase